VQAWWPGRRLVEVMVSADGATRAVVADGSGATRGVATEGSGAMRAVAVEGSGATRAVDVGDSGKEFAAAGTRSDGAGAALGVCGPVLASCGVCLRGRSLS
jgi:hypothetical protein